MNKSRYIIALLLMWLESELQKAQQVVDRIKEEMDALRKTKESQSSK